jgi:heat shock protein HspQ
MNFIPLSDTKLTGPLLSDLTMTAQANFSVGQLIQHLKFGYRGVVVDVDPVFQGSDDWYNEVAKSQPPKDQPWYHVLVDDAEYITYVAERNLEADSSGEPVDHPALEAFFAQFENGAYQLRNRLN